MAQKKSEDKQEPVFIPVNYTDSGKIAGMFKIRNLMEAAVVFIVIGMPLIRLIRLSSMMKLAIIFVILLPLLALALFGIGGDSLFERFFYMVRFVFRRRKLHLRRVGYRYAKETLRKPRRPVGEISKYIRFFGF